MLISMLSPLLLPASPGSSTYLAVVPFFHHLLHAEPRLLGLTLAGITLGLLALRLLDGRGVPFVFRVPALGVAVLALACVAGLVPASWPLALAAVAVGLLLLDEAVYLVAYALGRAVSELSAPLASIRRALSARSAARATTPAGGESQS